MTRIKAMTKGISNLQKYKLITSNFSLTGNHPQPNNMPASRWTPIGQRPWALEIDTYQTIMIKGIILVISTILVVPILVTKGYKQKSQTSRQAIKNLFLFKFKRYNFRHH
jgi:hypothetical protein